MKSTFIRSIAALATVATTAVGLGAIATPGAIAAAFGQQEVDQTKFVAVASPVNNGQSHQLLVLEQMASSRTCWSESGNTPTQIDPLLLNFDFSGICGRSTDSNGYSLRINGEDKGVQYSLRVRQDANDLVLIGVPFGGRGPTYELARANGFSPNFTKLNLNQGWRFTKRTYEGRTLGHVYLTYEGDVSQIPTTGSGGGTTNPNPGGGTTNPGGGTTNPIPTLPKFPDINGDLYQKDIESAVDIGFIAGFSEDNTFRPRATLTREQVVSMALGSIDALPDVTLNLPSQVNRTGFSDVSASRWSAAKIQFAQENGIVAGYGNGQFRPSQPVTRAELMAIMRRTAEYAKTLQGESTTLEGTQTAVSFADTTNHWANPLVNQMSSYCGVASPLNEQGANFAPDAPALRNYAAAATLRTLNCLKQ